MSPAAEPSVRLPPAAPDAAPVSRSFGLLPHQRIEQMVERRMIAAHRAIEDTQYQPASLDLRLGSTAFRVRASFLPGRARGVQSLLATMQLDELDLEGNGAILERGCVYVVPLEESLALPGGISAVANPKSSTGRLDVFTRLITDHTEVFDQVASGYCGKLYAEISPRSFSVRVRRGSKLNQIRFRHHDSAQADKVGFELSDKELRARHEASRLVDDEALMVRNGVILRVGLTHGGAGDVVGYRAQKHTGIVDVDDVGAYAVEDFWDRLRPRADGKLILDPGEFYILASRERLHIPPDLAAEMVPIDPAMGEFRVHYAGFFDPGFGFTAAGHPGSRAVLEVRSHEVPFILEDGQVIGRLAYEKMVAAPDRLYGESGVSNYQGQGLKLSKHFRM